MITTLLRASRPALVLSIAFLGAAGCRPSEEEVAAPPAPSPVSTVVPEAYVVNAAVPIEGYLALDARQLEAERLDEAWRADAERDRLMRQGIAMPGATPAPTGAAPPGTPSPASAASAPVERLRTLMASAGGATAAATPRATPQPSPAAKGKTSSGAETWEQISPDAFATFEPRFPIAKTGGGPTVLAVQQLLDRVRFSPGAVDGHWGKNTEKAVYWLQAALGLEATGTVDADLFARLREAAGTTSPVRQYPITDADIAGPFTAIPDDYMKQADLDCLCYASAAEALAERFHMTTDLLKKLNPDADLEHLAAGTQLWVLDVEPFDATAARAGTGGSGATGEAPVAELVISKDGFYLQALDANRQVLYHFPTTVGAGYDASPSGDLTVTATSYNPTFHYQPKLFADVDDSKPEANLPAGPNSPVGVVWMQLSKENFGIHGTAEPANIGYRTSHGCVRLTNWDALFLAQHIDKGTPVHFRGLDPEAMTPTR